MSDDLGKKIEGHAYDGIEELDNGLPGWWLNGFYLTIVLVQFTLATMFLGSGPGLRDEYHSEKEALVQMQESIKPAAGAVTDEVLAGKMKDPNVMKLGAAVYTSKCISCHGDKGQGGIGPNLTDNHWIHGGKLTQIYKTVSEGVLDKGMPPWASVLQPEEMPAVVAFVKSLKGTNPPGAKAAQGELEKE